jgi:hypothetical protein
LDVLDPTAAVRSLGTDASIVHLFVQWLYDPNPAFSVFLDEYFIQLARLFEFAQRLLIRQLKNYVIWQLFNLRSILEAPRRLPQKHLFTQKSFLPVSHKACSGFDRQEVWSRPI